MASRYHLRHHAHICVGLNENIVIKDEGHDFLNAGRTASRCMEEESKINDMTKSSWTWEDLRIRRMEYAAAHRTMVRTNEYSGYIIT